MLPRRRVVRYGHQHTAGIHKRIIIRTDQVAGNLAGYDVVPKSRDGAVQWPEVLPDAVPHMSARPRPSVGRDADPWQECCFDGRTQVAVGNDGKLRPAKGGAPARPTELGAVHACLREPA